MRVEIFWVDGPGPGRIGAMPRPRGGDWLEEEIRDLRRVGVDTLVSMLTDAEIHELELRAERDAATASGIEFLHFPIPDRDVPENIEAFVELLTKLASRVNDSKTVAVHCRMGIGRTSLTIVPLLYMLGESVSTAFQSVERARGRSVPDTEKQKKWIETLCENTLTSLVRGFD